MASYRQAFALSKTEVKHALPPGSVQLFDRGAGAEARGDHIWLVPEPSSDPADPLMWSNWRKFGALWTISLYSFVANFTSASLAPALPFLVYAFDPPQSLPSLTHLIAVNLLMLGASNLWWVPLSQIFGRRVVLLLATLMLTLATMWCGLTGNFGSLLAARTIQGIGGGAADAVGPAVVGDIFFMHQHGRAMAVYTVFLALGSTVGSISGSYIAGGLGWLYISWIGVALSAGAFLHVLFLVPETIFDRVNQETAPGGSPLGAGKLADASHIEIRHDVEYAPFTFKRSMRFGLYRGNVLAEFARPFATLLFPGVWVVMLQYGGLVGGIATMATIGPQLVSVPPYLWGSNAGLINVGGVIGTLLGGLATYVGADRRLKKLALREEDGLAEPETRLPIIFPSLFLATAGMLVYGFSGEYPGEYRWLGLQFGLGMLCFGLMQMPSIGFSYIIDSYGELSGDCFVIITSFRAVISFAWTFFAGTWVAERGAAEPFGIFALLMGIFSLLLIPLWLYGKRARIVTAKLLPGYVERSNMNWVAKRG